MQYGESEYEMLLRRVQSTSSSAPIRDAYLLPGAARAAYQKALSEKLPLAHIADQSERPQLWFANNILQVVGVHGKSPDDGEYVHLTRETTGGLKLMDDMTALVAPDEERPRYVDLRVTKADFDRYMEWARTVY